MTNLRLCSAHVGGAFLDPFAPPPTPRGFINNNKIIRHGKQLWNEDQGFFKVNKPLTGDFVVIARFKGTDGAAETGPEGVLFRYCNHTCFLSQGEQVVLRKSEVRGVASAKRPSRFSCRGFQHLGGVLPSWGWYCICIRVCR